MTNKTTRPAWTKTAALSAAMAGAALLGTTPAWAGAAAQKCQAGKNTAAGSYFSCLAKAEKTFVTAGDAAKYDAAVVKCKDKLQATWAKLEAAATAAGDPCPSTGDAVGVQDLLDGCSDGVSDGTSGGTVPPSPVVCLENLQSCVNPGGVPATGQTTSYGAGSDGDTQRGVTTIFTDNGDGTITDNVTGLMWEKKSDDGSIHDKDNSYTWGMDTAPYTMNGTMVTTFLAALNGGSGFAGHTDWRIPTIKELQTLVNFQIAYPGPTVFPEFNASCTGGCTVMTCSCTQSDLHWSSTTYQDYPDGAWGVGFNGGDTGATHKADDYYVRAVRAGS